MQIAKSVQELTQITKEWANKKVEWAFVPTMGALHDGHLTLAKAAKKDFDYVVVSIFVNPTQFDRDEDLDKYPRQPEQDAKLLSQLGVDLLFLPSVEVMYPNGTSVERSPEFGGLNLRYEGASRPGHFEGVVQVVRRLLNIVGPKAMYMGQKDAQQVAVLKQIARQEFWYTKIVVVPTVREDSGLAMSSRNALLSKKGTQKAALISQTLAKAASKWLNNQDPRSIESEAKTELIEAGFRLEYFDLIDEKTFEALPNKARNTLEIDNPIIVVVAWLENVRLIDNWPLT